ncbi:MAG: hypothetical protein IJN59_03380 [Oscillospiraceae bacterium]|nr:hypothetical protein [Oscillospiraceae bacterium]
MKQYTDVNNTPLKFYKFNMYLRLPLGILGALYLAKLLFNPQAVDILGTYGTIRVAVTAIASAVFAVGAIVGMKKFRPHCWYFQMAFEAVTIVMAAADVMFDIYIGAFQFVATMGLFFSATAVSLAIMLYFYKRKPLFFIQSQKLHSSFCIMCGSEILPQDAYCSVCGNTVPSVADNEEHIQKSRIAEKINSITSNTSVKKYTFISCIFLLVLSVACNVYQRSVINEAVKVISMYDDYYEVDKKYDASDAEYIRHLEEQNENFWQHKINYDTVCKFLTGIKGKTKDSSFYPDTEYMIVTAASPGILTITSTNSNAEIYYRSNNGCVSLELGEATDSTVTLKVTGIKTGADIVAIEDKVNNKSFNVLVIVA